MFVNLISSTPVLIAALPELVASKIADMHSIRELLTPLNTQYSRIVKRVGFLTAHACLALEYLVFIDQLQYKVNNKSPCSEGNAD